MSKRFITALVFTTMAVSARAQNPGAGTQANYGVGDTSIFAPLDLSPGPNLYRSASGMPGPQYWQNRADYDLHATLDTARHSVLGSMTLHYTNHSPDTLRFVWFFLEQNLSRAGALNSLIFPPSNVWATKVFPGGGDVIDRFTQVVGGKQIPLALRDQGTIAEVELARPLAPGATATFQAAWHFIVIEHSVNKTSREGALYEVAQWYPRVCVYDDVRGWNTEPYMGQGEFYLEYGDYTLAVTVPVGYIVAATGMLENGEEVLPPAQRKRLAQAAKSDTTIRIITAAELRSGTARPKKTGTLTWKFRAKNVRDAVFAASPDYQWDVSSWHGILTQAYYRSDVAQTWSDVADMGRMSIQEYSERWYPYPYPQVTAVEGPVQGTEYPMFTMDGRELSGSVQLLYSVVTHEIGHNWFPMIVGSNERIHTWMDEGFNTFINTFSEARRYPAQGSQAQRAAGGINELAQLSLPIDIPNDRLPEQIIGALEYGKPSAGLQLLREEILGPEVFDDAFRTYIKRWAFKHPTPADFYRTMENVSGRRLDWFWQEWFVENPTFDQAIDTVATRMAGDTMRLAVQYGNRARGVLPLRVRFTFNDNSTQEFVYPAEVWSTNSQVYIRRYAFPGKRVTRIDLDPDHRLPDVNRSNNTWVSPH